MVVVTASRVWCHCVLLSLTQPFLNPPVSLPRLVDMDWRVDIKTSSDSIARMAVPTCLLQLKVMAMAVRDRNNEVQHLTCQADQFTQASGACLLPGGSLDLLRDDT